MDKKTIVWLGSSVTYGSANGGISMADYLGEEDYICHKYAVSGTTLTDDGPKSYVSRLIAADLPDTCDLFICQLSTNDARKERPIGTASDSFDIGTFDTQTVAGAAEYIIAFAKNKWNCPVAFYTNPPYPNGHYGKMAEMLLSLRGKWDLHILDMWNSAELRSMSDEEYEALKAKYMKDRIHPNEQGYREWWTPMFRDFIDCVFYGNP